MIDVRLGGDRLTEHQLQGLRYTLRINQRSKCDLDTYWLITDPAEGNWQLEDLSGCWLLEDGTGCWELEAGTGRRIPRFNESISIDVPGTTYRQRVLDRGPQLYWALDERPGKDEVRDWSGFDNAGGVGAGVLLRDRDWELTALGYGGCLRPNTGAVTADDFIPPETATLQFWFRRPARSTHDDYMVELNSDVGRWGVGHDATRIYFDLGPGRPIVPDIPAVLDTWRLLSLVWTPTRITAYIDGVQHWSGVPAAVPPWSPAAGVTIREGDYWIDELSIDDGAADADDAADDYAARSNIRVFEGYSLDPTVEGREADGAAEVKVPGAALGVLLERHKLKLPVVTDPVRRIPDLIDDFLEPIDVPITTDGIAFPVAVGRQPFSLESYFLIFRRLVEIGGGDMWVESWGEMQGLPRSGYRAQPGLRFDGSNTERCRKIDDSQNFRTEQTIVGTSGGRAETSEYFRGDGSNRVFGPTRLPPTNIQDITVNGVSEAWTGMGAPWSVDLTTFTLTRTTAPSAPGPTAPLIDGERKNVRITYQSDFPIVATVRSTEGEALYGVWGAIDEDRTADDTALATERARTLLGRHDVPTRRLSIQTVQGAFGPLRPGVLARVHLPVVFETTETDMLIDTVSTTVALGEDSELVHTVELVAGDYESRYIDYLKQIGRITTPIGVRFEQRNTPTVYTIDPIDAALSGIDIPAPLGGSPAGNNNKRDMWLPIAGAAVVPLNGRRYASLRGRMIVTFNSRVKPPTAGAWTAAVRLYNRTAGAAVGAPVSIVNPARTVQHIRNIAIAQTTSEYELQYRITYGGASTIRPALFVWGAVIGAGLG